MTKPVLPEPISVVSILMLLIAFVAGFTLSELMYMWSGNAALDAQRKVIEQLRHDCAAEVDHGAD